MNEKPLKAGEREGATGSYSMLEQNVQKIHNTRTLFPVKISITCQGKGKKVI